MNRAIFPRVLIVTPEITYLPPGMGNMANYLAAKAGGLADVTSALISALFEQGADVHVALPHYRQMFNFNIGRFISEELRAYKTKLPDERIHLAEDRIFYYRSNVYSPHEEETPKLAMAFQREVINNIIPRVRPDIIHCNDWMTGLIPAFARRLQIPCLFTVHNIHSLQITLAQIEDSGIDSAEFWQYLYYQRFPASYAESRATNPVNFLISGIFAAHFINTVSPAFLREMTENRFDFVDPKLCHEIAGKNNSGCAAGILNAPNPSYNPSSDPALVRNFTAENCLTGKSLNKKALQRRLNLKPVSAPLFFWPSRLDPRQKGCSLLADILPQLIKRYGNDGLQAVFVANGEYQPRFHEIVAQYKLQKNAVVCNFSEELSRLAYAASDFVLMPSLFEPCGLPQMISCKYGSLPVARDTGGIHDTISHLDLKAGTGNGFLFKDYDSNGLSWAIDQAMAFYKLPKPEREKHLARIMRESSERFTHSATALAYINLYERMLARPLV
ncbi:MAG: glycogen/starch synthase [Kiritimatiellia bacterium]|nr:glycogen/starch synthase [Kiritimatiellia bacterium]